MSKQTTSLRRIKQANDFIGRQPGIEFIQPDLPLGFRRYSD